MLFQSSWLLVIEVEVIVDDVSAVDFLYAVVYDSHIFRVVMR